MAEYRIGISGWTYRPWRGTFYPKGLVQKRELAHASRQLNTIEINGSFYSLQTPNSYRTWYEQTPDDFVFAVKGSRFITHLKRLTDTGPALSNFLASGLLLLREKLGPILWQLPPMFVFREDRLANFFKHLPRDTAQAARLARKHDERLANRAWTKTDETRPLRHALEVRHPSFENPRFIELLREHNIALVVADTAGKFPFLEDVTSDFVYVRLHGDEELYVSGYTESSLDEWARKCRAWHDGKNPRGTRTVGPKGSVRKDGRDVFVYFDNDVKVRAPFDAMSLAHKLGIGAKPGEPPPAETISETARTIWPSIVRRWDFRDKKPARLAR
jgi:uncharacterized protein YecE (DUF72 family)